MALVLLPAARMLKFIHCADLHLDSPIRNLERYPGAPVEMVRQATRRALENLVQFALDQQVRLIVMAGDLYDGDWTDFETGLYFVHQMQRLREADIRVCLISGNHDAENRMTRQLRLPEHVLRLESRAPQTLLFDDLGVAIHGQSFAQRDVTENLAARYPASVPGLFNLGLLHTCGEGVEGHENYAPCSRHDLDERDYHYWALGHIHKRMQLPTRTPAMFPGNTQGRHIRESGPKGCLLVTVDDRFQVNCRFQPLDVFRWERVEMSARGVDAPEGVLERFAETLRRRLPEFGGRPAAIRVEVNGPCPAHSALLSHPERWTQEVRAVAGEVSPGQVWIEKVLWNTSFENDAWLPTDGPLAELFSLLDEMRHDPRELSALVEELSPLRKALPAELAQCPDAPALDDPQWVAALLETVKPLLLDRLQEESAP